MWGGHGSFAWILNIWNKKKTKNKHEGSRTRERMWVPEPVGGHVSNALWCHYIEDVLRIRFLISPPNHSDWFLVWVLAAAAFLLLLVPTLRPHLSVWLRAERPEVRDEALLVSYSSWCNREQLRSKLPSSGIIPAHAINEVIVLDYKICIFKT